MTDPQQLAEHSAAAMWADDAASQAMGMTLAEVRPGDVLVAEAVERTRSGRNGVYDVTVRREGEVVAEFRGRSLEIGGTLVAVEPDMRRPHG